MLTEESYLSAIYVYVAMSALMLLYLAYWLRRYWQPAVVAMAVLVSAALLLTPAYPAPGAETFAPALVVAAFTLLTEGTEAASHALRPLGIAVAIALVLALLLKLLLWLRSGRGQSSAGDAS